MNISELQLLKQLCNLAKERYILERTLSNGFLYEKAIQAEEIVDRELNSVLDKFIRENKQ